MKGELNLSAYLKIKVCDEGTTAILHFHKFDPSFQCTSRQLIDWLNQQNIVYGIDVEAVDQICSAPETFIDTEVTIAKGIPPTKGDDGNIVYHTETKISTSLPKETEDGKVDYKQIRILNNVRKGQLIAEKIPPRVGVNGRSVYGKVIPAPAGKEAVLKPGKNVVFNKENNCIYAAIDGLVKEETGAIHVLPVYEVKGDVNYETGNIDFVGTVIVHGNVLDEFTIKASGDIYVHGVVEAAYLEAGGTIFVEKGIIGRQKGKITANGDLITSFIQEGNIQAGGSVTISQFIMHSHISAGKTVSCLGKKGLIVGGEIFAGERVEAITIGNPSSTRTMISVGQHNEMHKKIEQLQLKQKEIQLQKDKTKQALAMMDTVRNDRIHINQLKMKIQLQNTEKQLDEELTQLQEQIQKCKAELSKEWLIAIVARKYMYAGTHILMGIRTKHVKNTLENVIFKLSDGEISMVPYK